MSHSEKRLYDLEMAIKEFDARLRSRRDTSMTMSLNSVRSMLKEELEDAGFGDILEPKL